MTAAFDGKVALVTGAGGGIGLATAEAFAGASVVVADRDEATIGKAAGGLRAAGHNATGVICDVTDTAQVEAMIERAVSTYGRLDAAFNNAGVNSEAAAVLETSDDEFDRVMNINLRGVWNCMKGDPDIVRRMVAQEPLGRFGEADEIAAAVVWLCNPAASFMIGHAMAVDGGILAG